VERRAELLKAALGYAGVGLAVLPLHSVTSTGDCTCARADCDRPGKHPRPRHGLYEATTEVRAVRRWWSGWPEANIGLRTGGAVDVCDVDSAAGLRALVETVPDDALGITPVCRTGSGGWHLYFAATGMGNRVGLLPGVDWRGAGGYVVAPPSVHATGGRYRWERDAGVPPPVCPPSLLRLLAGSAAAREPMPARGRGAPPPRRIHHHRRYGEAALAKEVRRLATAPPGTRNDSLNRAAFALGQLVGAGLLDERRVREALTSAARATGLGPVEVRGTLRSGLRAGLRQPRHQAA
jgi:hypothetical protein